MLEHRALLAGAGRASGCLFVVSAVEVAERRRARPPGQGPHARRRLRGARAAARAGIAAAAVARRVHALDHARGLPRPARLDRPRGARRRTSIRCSCSIRLLVPPGSPARRAAGDAAAPARARPAGLRRTLWDHPDPRMDRLQREVDAIVRRGGSRRGPAESGRSPRAATRRTGRAGLPAPTSVLAGPARRRPAAPHRTVVLLSGRPRHLRLRSPRSTPTASRPPASPIPAPACSAAARGHALPRAPLLPPQSDQPEVALYLPNNEWLQGADGPGRALNLRTCRRRAMRSGKARRGLAESSCGRRRVSAATTPARCPDVFLHEWGHGLDQNDATGHGTGEATGEATGDTFALLQGQQSCIGPGFWLATCSTGTGATATGYGTVTARLCTGIRDLDYTKILLPAARAWTAARRPTRTRRTARAPASTRRPSRPATPARRRAGDHVIAPRRPAWPTAAPTSTTAADRRRTAAPARSTTAATASR